MIVPALHFCGDCKDAITLYEKAFNTKAHIVITNSQFSPDECGDDQIAHAEMILCGQRVLLNDRFGNKDKSPDMPVRLIVMFETADELLNCFEYFKDGSIIVDPFEAVSYSKLFGNFIDPFGIGWGFMVEST